MCRLTTAAMLAATLMLCACSRVNEWDRAYGIVTPEAYRGEPLSLDD